MVLNHNLNEVFKLVYPSTSQMKQANQTQRIKKFYLSQRDIKTNQVNMKNIHFRDFLELLQIM